MVFCSCNQGGLITNIISTETLHKYTPEQENNTGLTGIRFGNIGSREYLSGKLDDFGIWDRALNDNEVLELYLRLEVVLTRLLAITILKLIWQMVVHFWKGFDCDGNIEVEIGDEVFGGVVFYVEEGSDGQYGLVASTYYIGTGTWQQAFDQSASYENSGYTDWYLPHMHELPMIYNELHSTGSNVYNTGDVNNWYWSSEVCDSSSSASDVHFTDGSYNLCNNMSSSMGGIIAIQSFGEVEYGCTDSIAFNFNSEANLDDGSCLFSAQDYSLSLDGIDDYVSVPSDNSSLDFLIKIKYLFQHGYI